MTKAQFLNELDRALAGVAYQDKQEIMADYVEHFRAGTEAGKSEEDICTALGSPRSIARAYRADYMVEQARSTNSVSNIFRAVVAVISLGFFNLVFVLGPFLGLVGVMIGLWAAGAAVTTSGVVGAMAALAGLIFPGIVSGAGPLFVIGAFFLCIALTAVGLLLCIGLYYLTLGFCKLSVKYLNMNLRIINGRGNRNE